MADDDNVTKLLVRLKNAAPEDRTLLRPWEVQKHDKCMHHSFVVDDKKTEVECATCGEKLNPMWVLVQLASKDMRMQEAAKRYKDEMARLAERERTKCQHCGQITRISRR
jgi:ribosomal protein S27E